MKKAYYSVQHKKCNSMHEAPTKWCIREGGGRYSQPYPANTGCFHNLNLGLPSHNATTILYHQVLNKIKPCHLSLTSQQYELLVIETLSRINFLQFTPQLTRLRRWKKKEKKKIKIYSQQIYKNTLNLK